MSTMKKILVKGMNDIMLSCDTATYLITRSEYENLHCLKKMQIRMHLAACKYCRRFASQSKYISAQLDKIKNLETRPDGIYLTENQKQKIRDAIEKQI